MLLEKQAANYCLPDSTNSEIILFCLSFLKWALMSGQFMMDIALASVDRIELKLNFPKLVALQVPVPLKLPFWWYIWKLVDYLDAFIGFNIPGWMTAWQIWSVLFNVKLFLHWQGCTTNNFLPPVFSLKVNTHGLFPFTHAIDYNIFHCGLIKKHILIIIFPYLTFSCTNDMLVQI